MTRRFSVFKSIEDFLCDKLDRVFDDNLVCQKEFDPTNECRAFYISGTSDGIDDQRVNVSCTAYFKECRFKRSDAIDDMAKFNSIFPIYSEKISNGFALFAELHYITAPTQIVVGTKKAYLLSGTVKVYTV